MRVGILGSMVWDRIEHPDARPVERWGGISYSLAAAGAALPEGWTLSPIVKVGRDLAVDAERFLETIPGLERPGGVVVVDEPNNRVHLRYRDRQRRHECLSGGVPAWDWAGLEPRLDGLDALFVNLISGFELGLETAERLRDRFRGPVYADLHSLLLDVADDGSREPRPLERPDRWLAAFDVVQVNDRELDLVAGDRDPRALAVDAVLDGLGALLVTRGPGGATWLAPADRPFPWRTDGRGATLPAAPEDGRGTEPGGAGSPADAVRSGGVEVAGPVAHGDPTGCGDVWGATCFLALLRGEALTTAMAAANRAAARNVAHQGADGLYRYLREET